jgi:NADH dehydrogenase
VLSDGSTIKTRCVIWGAGLKAASVGGGSGLPKGRGGRISVEPDLTVEEFPGVYAVGDFANMTGSNGGFLPQLGAVAQQSGRWAAKNILADLAGKPGTAFHYHDKGITAMIGKTPP